MGIASTVARFQKPSRHVAVISDPRFSHPTCIGKCPDCKSRIGLTGQSATWEYRGTFYAAEAQVPTRVASSHQPGSTVVQVDLG